MKTTLSLCEYENLKGKQFEELMDLCFEVCDFFTLNIYNYGNNHPDCSKFLEQLEPYYVKTIFTTQCFFYLASPVEPMETCIYHTSSKAKEVLKIYFDSLFFEYKDFSIYRMPENICFFKSGRLFLGTISHEFICYVYPYSENIKQRLLSIKNCKEIKYDEDEHLIMTENEIKKGLDPFRIDSPKIKWCLRRYKDVNLKPEEFKSFLVTFEDGECEPYWVHCDYCIICVHKFVEGRGEDDECCSLGYVLENGEMVCKNCFEKFKDVFHWKLISND